MKKISKKCKLVSTCPWTESCMCMATTVAVCCSVLQCDAVGCSVLQRVAESCMYMATTVAECCSVLQCGSVWFSVLQCVAVCCSVLQCVAVCCTVYGDHATRLMALLSASGPPHYCTSICNRSCCTFF